MPANIRTWHAIIRQCMLHGRKSVVPASTLTQLCHTYDSSTDKTRALVALGRAGYYHKSTKLTPTTSQDCPMAMIDARERLLPDYQPLISACGRTPEGLRFIMTMRQDCLGALRDPTLKSDENLKKLQAIQALERDLFTALSGWFSAGLAQIQRVRWDTSSGELLENLMNFEAVHAINSVADLKHRLYLANRRVFTFCHPVTGPNQPLVVLYVALTREISDSVDHLIRDEHEAPVEQPTTAIFYSISSRGNSLGLAQIDLGNHMIRNAVLSLKTDHPTINTYSTLSPMPGFAAWLRQFKTNDPTIYALYSLYEKNPSPGALLKIFITENDPLLRKYAARYLYEAKRRGNAFDGVANFHLRNGAAIYRVNMLADTSDKGFRESFGYMVNYKYDLERIEENQQNYHFSQQIRVLQPFDQDLAMVDEPGTTQNASS